MDEVRAQNFSRPSDGYLAALGYLQIGTGSLSLMMSLMLFFQALFSHSELLNPATAFDSSFDLLDRAIATYVSLQLSIGWVAGALQLAAGICCLHARRPRLVWLASLVSLANFPHGTMAALLTILALRRPDLAHAFEAAREDPGATLGSNA
jgi:hypothetical protein